MAKNTRGMSLFPSGIESESLPIAVATLIVDGKRLTPAFYKQITEADLIAEDTGELRGLPLGYFHLHTKSCPEKAHTHVLWGTETELHLATVFAMQQDERYQQQKQHSLQRQERLIHLLALLLGLADHPHTVEWVGQDERKLTIAGYTLYVDENIADRLKKLQQAREQQMKDKEAWQARQASDESRNPAPASDKEQRAAAEAILAQLDQQGIELKHPAQDEIEGKELAVHDYYTALVSQTTWCRYPAPSESGSREEPLLYWRAKDLQQRRLQKERLTPAVANLLAPPHAVWLLRLLFAERMAQAQLARTRDSAEYLLRDADIAALLQQKPRGAKARKKESFSPDDLDPDQVWACYDRESKYFNAFTQRWKSSLEQIQAVKQLFLVS
jgi:hypothetical protein